MKPIAAFFCPPLYFLLQGKPVAAGLHLIFWILSILTLFIVIGFFIWAVQVSIAGWDLRKQMMADHATDIATKIAAATRPSDLSST